MATEGVILGSHYVFQVCAPTRASILTGRYPWGIGFYYVGGDNLGVPTEYEMLPQQLRRLAKAQTGADVATHAIGKVRDLFCNRRKCCLPSTIVSLWLYVVALR